MSDQILLALLLESIRCPNTVTCFIFALKWRTNDIAHKERIVSKKFDNEMIIRLFMIAYPVGQTGNAVRTVIVHLSRN